MRKVLALTLTSLLGACQLAPPHARPALPTAQDYPTSYAGDVVLGRRAVEISWREFFADPKLETFVATALARNRDLADAVAQITEARGLHRIQRSVEQKSELQSIMRNQLDVLGSKH